MKTGNGTAVTFGTSGITGSWTKIGEWQTTLGKLESSHLGTEDNKTYEPDDLAEPGEIDLELFFDPAEALPTLGVPESVTITFPKDVAGSAAAATLVGTGFLTAAGTPEMVNGTLSKQKCKLAYDGKTGPAFTVEA